MGRGWSKVGSKSFHGGQIKKKLAAIKHKHHFKDNFIHTQLVFTCFYVIVMRNTGPEKTHKKPNRNKGKRVCVGVRRVFSPQFPKNLHLLLCDKTELETDGIVGLYLLLT